MKVKRKTQKARILPCSGHSPEEEESEEMFSKNLFDTYTRSGGEAVGVLPTGGSYETLKAATSQLTGRPRPNLRNRMLIIPDHSLHEHWSEIALATSVQLRMIDSISGSHRQEDFSAIKTRMEDYAPVGSLPFDSVIAQANPTATDSACLTPIRHNDESTRKWVVHQSARFPAGGALLHFDYWVPKVQNLHDAGLVGEYKGALDTRIRITGRHTEASGDTFDVHLHPQSHIVSPLMDMSIHTEAFPDTMLRYTGFVEMQDEHLDSNELSLVVETFHEDGTAHEANARGAFHLAPLRHTDAMVRMKQRQEVYDEDDHGFWVHKEPRAILNEEGVPHVCLSFAGEDANPGVVSLTSQGGMFSTCRVSDFEWNPNANSWQAVARIDPKNLTNNRLGWYYIKVLSRSPTPLLCSVRTFYK